MEQKVIQFGISLDKDDFERTKALLSDDCQYKIGDEILLGPTAICHSYESNMIEGREKLDELKWGESRVERISDNEFYVHFTDYLKHNNYRYTHRCKQKITINKEGLISYIEHIHDAAEQEWLDAFYRSVGLLE